MKRLVVIGFRMDNGTEWCGGASVGNTLGAYAHAHFAGAPELAVSFLENCRAQGIANRKGAD